MYISFSQSWSQKDENYALFELKDGTVNYGTPVTMHRFHHRA